MCVFVGCEYAGGHGGGVLSAGRSEREGGRVGGVYCSRGVNEGCRDEDVLNKIL